LDDSLIEVTLTTDIRNLRTAKKVPTWQPATITMHFSDTLEITEQIRVRPRGITRKDICDIASLSFNFKDSLAPRLSHLKQLKLVGSCNMGNTNEEFLLKEYLVYKIYNILSIMSFRVRLLHVSYRDSKQKVKSYSQYAFLIEDMKDMADRNNCVEVKNKKISHGSHGQASNYFYECVSIYGRQYRLGCGQLSQHKTHGSEN
jgi:hypothetical protein